MTTPKFIVQNFGYMKEDFRLPKLLFVCLSTVLCLGIVWYVINTHKYLPQVNDPTINRDLAVARLHQKSGDMTAAASILKLHVGTNHPRVLFQYAKMKARGWGTDRNLEVARDLMLRAVAQPFSHRGEVAFELAKIYRLSGGRNCQRIALEWFHKALSWGYEKAHRELGKAYERGYGTETDYHKAIYHYDRSAHLGSAASVPNLIHLIRNGNPDVPPNLHRTEQLLSYFIPILESRANSGEPHAARSLARLYNDKTLHLQKSEKIAHWLAVASRLGDAPAMHDLAVLASNELPDLLSHNEIIDLLETSAQRGYSAAFTTLARYHLEKRFGLEPINSIKWLEKGIAAGHPGAMEEMAKLSIAGKLVPKDIQRATDLARLGALMKHKGCQEVLNKLISKKIKIDSTQLTYSKIKG